MPPVAVEQRHPLAKAVLGRLWAIQAERELNNSELAARLGVAQSTISRLRSGQLGLSLELTLKACETFPELRSLLSSDVRERIDVVPVVTEQEGR